MYYVALFEDETGKRMESIFDCPCLEDATIEATNWAEDNGLELLAVDPKN